MTRKTKQASLPQRIRPGEYERWCKSFKGYANVPALLKQLAAKGVNVEQMLVLLHLAATQQGNKVSPRRDVKKLTDRLDCAQRHLRKTMNCLEAYNFEQPRRDVILGTLSTLLIKLKEQQQVNEAWIKELHVYEYTDVAIGIIAQELERAGSRRVNEMLADLLCAAGIGQVWSAETVAKRRNRLAKNPFALSLARFTATLPILSPDRKQPQKT